MIQVRKFVIRREVQPKKEGAKPYTKAPRIQRLVTPQRLQHKRHRIALKRRRAEASKDAAVSLALARDENKSLTLYRTSTLRSSTSVSTRRRASRPRSARGVHPACASRCYILCCLRIELPLCPRQCTWSSQAVTRTCLKRYTDALKSRWSLAHQNRNEKHPALLLYSTNDTNLAFFVLLIHSHRAPSYMIVRSESQ